MSLQDKPFSVYCENGFCLAAAEVFSIIHRFLEGKALFYGKKGQNDFVHAFGKCNSGAGYCYFCCAKRVDFGGVTGVALILQHFFGISVDIGVYVADVVLLFWALWLWEKPLQQPLFSAPWFIRPFLLCLEKFRF